MIYSFDVPRTFVFVRVSVAVVEFKSVFFKIIISPPSLAPGMCALTSGKKASVAEWSKPQESCKGHIMKR